MAWAIPHPSRLAGTGPPQRLARPGGLPEFCKSPDLPRPGRGPARI